MKMFDTYKIRMIGLPCGEETITIMLSRFDTIPERDGPMDRRTDRQKKLMLMLMLDMDRHTDRQTCRINITR